MKAAAKGYFGKALEDLTLAEDAILAAIPQSPTKFDLVRNAEEICLDDPPPDPESDEVCQESHSRSRRRPRSSSGGTTSST